MYNDDPFYKSAKWLDLRESALRRDKYMCQISKRYGKMIPAEIVHHIFPRDKYPEYEYEPWNLISVTLKEHNRLHDRNTDELTDAGIELLRRTALKNGIPIPEEYTNGIKRASKHEQRSRY